jgi:hypothetical protein
MTDSCRAARDQVLAGMTPASAARLIRAVLPASRRDGHRHRRHGGAAWDDIYSRRRSNRCKQRQRSPVLRGLVGGSRTRRVAPRPRPRPRSRPAAGSVCHHLPRRARPPRCGPDQRPTSPVVPGLDRHGTAGTAGSARPPSAATGRTRQPRERSSPRPAVSLAACGTSTTRSRRPDAGRGDWRRATSRSQPIADRLARAQG